MYSVGDVLRLPDGKEHLVQETTNSRGFTLTVDKRGINHYQKYHKTGGKLVGIGYVKKNFRERPDILQPEDIQEIQALLRRIQSIHSPNPFSNEANH
jgi:hypothetical protein